jgi:hypothetical protein
MKLGEILIRKGIISNDQLKDTLRAQMIFGGQLGTCLIEKGYVGEKVLGSVLAEVTGADYAEPRLFAAIPSNVVDIVPPTLVAKHSFVPFRLRSKVLDVAMIDPRNLAAQDELSFATGCKVQPWVAPEARIYQAMEMHYGIPRRQRYVALCRQLDGEDNDAELLQRIVRIERDTAEEDEHAAAKPDPLVARRATDNSALDAVSEVLCKAESPQVIADAVLSYASIGMERCILFKMESGAAKVWRASGLGLEREAVAALRFPVISEPMFTLLRGELCYRGEVPADPAYERFFDRLRIDRPAEVLILPLYIDDRLVGFFYGDGGAGATIRGDTEDYRRLMKKLCLGLHVILLRRQIQVA